MCTLWLVFALGLFVISASLALSANFSMSYRSVDARDIRARLEAEDDSNDAALAVAELHAEILETAQEKNSLKGRLVTVALGIEVAAVACVSVTIVEVMTRRSPPACGTRGRGEDTGAEACERVPTPRAVSTQILQRDFS